MEYNVSNCVKCKIPIYIDEGYHKLGEHVFNGILCEECYKTKWLDYLDEEVEKIPNEYIIYVYTNEVIENDREDKTSTRELHLFYEIFKRMNNGR